MTDTVFLFYGFGSEYVLNLLYSEIKKRGYNCYEVDALNTRNSKTIIKSLIKRSVVFITSSHFLLDDVNFKDFYPSENKFYNVLQILALIKPKKSVYIPHDLTQPLINMENYFLNQFDLFLSPCEPFTSIYSQYCNTEELGWIKYTKKSFEKNKIKKRGKAIWFVSDFILHMKMGKKKSFKLLSSVLKQGVAIKFPNWDQCKEFEQYYGKMGAKVFSSTENSIDLINNHNIIITNGLSSIIAESYWLGKTTINITEGSYYGEERTYLKELFPNLIFIEKTRDFKLSNIVIKKSDVKLAPFNTNRAIELITKN
jgi:hypothetical protein